MCTIPKHLVGSLCIPTKIVGTREVLLFFGTVSFAKTLNDHHPLDTSFDEENLTKYEYETQGDSYLQSCDWEDESGATSVSGQKSPIPAQFSIENIVEGIIHNTTKMSKGDGICKNLNKEKLLSGNATGVLGKILLSFISGMTEVYKESHKLKNDDSYIYNAEGIAKFIGQDRAGSSFDLGAFAKCGVKQEKIEDMMLSKFCAGDENLSTSPAATLAAHTVDAMGLPSYGGKNGDTSTRMKKVADRIYPSGRTGEELFGDENGTNGGFLIEEAKNDPHSATAVALNSFDKATIVLKTLALQDLNSSDLNTTRLPATKAQSMDEEDEIVQMEVRMNADLNQFGDTLTRALRKEILKQTSIKGPKGTQQDLASQALYEMREKNVTGNFFKSKISGLSAIYKGIEDEAKARLSSEMLLLTTDPKYIADPSEARAALVKPSQRNKFRYAALIQQEKNKMLKLKYAREIKRKQQMIDLIKQQAYIRASIFRPDIAEYELNVTLANADASVELNTTGTTGSCLPRCNGKKNGTSGCSGCAN